MLSLIFLALVGCVSASSSWREDVVVDTDCGPLRGFMNHNETNATQTFLGVPFAAPPVGERRFSSPVSRKSAGMCWKEVRDATQLSESCLQSGQFQEGGAEDCLYLNVYAPVGVKNAPVFVYLYGGDLTDGKTSTYDQAANRLAALTGMVVVVPAYRVNLFGFLSLRALSSTSSRGSSGNYGFEDQLVALEWVQRNIANFGGDKDRVTLSGQSSGGTSALALLGSPRGVGLFHRVLSLSASTNITMDLETAEKQNEWVVGKLGCNDSDASKVVECLRSVPASSITAIVPSSWNTAAEIWSFPPADAAKYHSMRYNGIAIVDGVVIQTPLLTSLQHPINPVNLWVGWMADETDAQPGQLVSNLSSSAFHHLLNTTFLPWGDSAAATVTSTYSSLFDDQQLLYDDIMADYGQTCPSVYHITATAMESKTLDQDGDSSSTNPVSSSNFASVYAVVIDGSPSHPIWGFDETYQPRHAFHSFDILLGFADFDLWSRSFNKPHFQPEQEDLDLSAIVRQAWVDFATTGTSPLLKQAHECPTPTPASSSSSTPCVLVNAIGKGGKVRHEPNWRKDRCDMWEELGLGQGFWWCN